MSEQVDRREDLDNEPFSYLETKDNKVMLFWNGKHVKTLAAKEGAADFACQGNRKF